MAWMVRGPQIQGNLAVFDAATIWLGLLGLTTIWTSLWKPVGIWDGSLWARFKLVPTVVALVSTARNSS